MLVAIIFGCFENITSWQIFHLEILLKESGWGPYFFIWWLLILVKFINSSISPNKSSLIIYRFTAYWLVLGVVMSRSGRFTTAVDYPNHMLVHFLMNLLSWVMLGLHTCNGKVTPREYHFTIDEKYTPSQDPCGMIENHGWYSWF